MLNMGKFIFQANLGKLKVKIMINSVGFVYSNIQIGKAYLKLGFFSRFRFLEKFIVKWMKFALKFFKWMNFV